MSSLSIICYKNGLSYVNIPVKLEDIQDKKENKVILIEIIFLVPSGAQGMAIYVGHDDKLSRALLFIVVHSFFSISVLQMLLPESR